MVGTKRSNIKIGATVLVVQKQDQRNGKLTEGIVKKILTNSPEHHHGIKVMLESGIVGGVKEIRWYGLTWSLELYQQANARLYNSVIIHHLVSEGTVNEHVMEVLQTKDKGQSSLLQADL